MRFRPQQTNSQITRYMSAKIRPMSAFSSVRRRISAKISVRSLSLRRMSKISLTGASNGPSRKLCSGRRAAAGTGAEGCGGAGARCSAGTLRFCCTAAGGTGAAGVGGAGGLGTLWFSGEAAAIWARDCISRARRMASCCRRCIS
nr:hypothetical protein [uncultured Caproiciproducens sp.]